MWAAKGLGAIAQDQKMAATHVGPPVVFFCVKTGDFALLHYFFLALDPFDQGLSLHHHTYILLLFSRVPIGIFSGASRNT